MAALTLEQLRDHSMGNHVLGVEVKPGDRCFKEYEALIKAWTESPRWTTADELLRFLSPDDQERARILAYLVFFSMHVMKYEIQKQWQNGDITWPKA